MKILAIALAVAFVAIGVLYWIGRLQIGAGHPGPHHAHGALFFVLGVLSLVWARFQAAEPSPG